MFQITEPDPYAGMPLSAVIDAILVLPGIHNMTVSHARADGRTVMFVTDSDPWIFDFLCHWSVEIQTVIEAMHRVCALSFAENSLCLIGCQEGDISVDTMPSISQELCHRYIVQVRMEKSPCALDILHSVSQLRRTATS